MPYTTPPDADGDADGTGACGVAPRLLLFVPSDDSCHHPSAEEEEDDEEEEARSLKLRLHRALRRTRSATWQRSRLLSRSMVRAFAESRKCDLSNWF